MICNIRSVILIAFGVIWSPIVHGDDIPCTSTSTETPPATTTTTTSAPQKVNPKRGVCVIDNDPIRGSIYFSQQQPDGPVSISGQINGLPEGKHGLHIHKFGEISSCCSKVGPNFDPTVKSGAGDQWGDLGNAESNAEKYAKIDQSNTVISLYGEKNIFARSLVLQTGPGNQGEFVGCCVIGYARV